LAVALVVWGGGLLVQHLHEGPAAVEGPGWQRPFSELSEADQRFFRQLRESLFDVEGLRALEGTWPEAQRLKDLGFEPFTEAGWKKQSHGVYTTYSWAGPVGTKAVRWLVLYIEPSPQVLADKSPPPPDDEEHHTLRDGTPVHVTVWSIANDDTPMGDEVLAFPAAEGWLERRTR
jgi:hypothetical protein